jgi:glycosyltransferase involved in cell wall biosynthesis
MGPDLPLKILFIVPYVPDRIRTRPFHLIKALASEGHRVTLATLWSDREESAAAQRLAGHLESLLTERIRITRSIWNCVRALPSSRPIQASYCWSPKLARRIVPLVQTTHFDVIHIEHLRGVRYGLMVKETLERREIKRPLLVWDSVDCITQLFRQAAQESHAFRSRLTSRMELPRTARYEGWLVTRFGRVLVTSQTDRDELVKLAQNWGERQGVDSSASRANRVAVIPNGVDLDYFCPNGETREPATLVISGKMSYHANVTAVVRFVEEVMPRIWAERPETRLWIVGKDPSPEIQRLGVLWRDGSSAASKNGSNKSKIQITGTVEDVRPFLRRATLAVAPIQYGAGIQNKVLEALACGTPVVATPQAVTALQARPGQDLILARDLQELARSVLSLLKSPEHRLQLGQSGRQFVERHHQWPTIARNLTKIYRDAICDA